MTDDMNKTGDDQNGKKNIDEVMQELVEARNYSARKWNAECAMGSAYMMPVVSISMDVADEIIRALRHPVTAGELERLIEMANRTAQQAPYNNGELEFIESLKKKMEK